MKNILIPTDFSENAWNAIKYGLALYKKIHCNFHLIHVHPIVAFAGGEAAMYASQELMERNLLKESSKKLEKILIDIEHLPFNTKHTFHTSVFYGFFTDHIKQQVEDNNIDLIIMGTKGASGLQAVSMGSNTGNVITKVKCAVLAIPEDAEYRRPKEIALPTDYQMGYDIKVLEDVKDLSLINNSAVRILYAAKIGAELTNEQLKNKKFLDNYFKDVEHSFHTVTGNKLESVVQCFTESRDIDLIAMVAKNLNFLERILFRPTVEKISYHTKVPFLVLHEK
ncbi:universal stress protein [Maribacter sp. CXY002]|uniref:universal stress protein n=1 Tax=Maribacter luteocoastalis TaxID=3407671 RepID=UPI003B680305